MQGANLDARLAGLDKELVSAGIPLKYRPLDCFKSLYGSVPDGPRRAQLFDPVIEWYLKKYGDAARWDGIIARFRSSSGTLFTSGRLVSWARRRSWRLSKMGLRACQ